jgi:hypothetical protein
LLSKFPQKTPTEDVIEDKLITKQKNSLISQRNKDLVKKDIAGHEK